MNVSKQVGNYIQVGGGTRDECLWPDPSALGELDWALRYSTPTREQLMHAASVLHAYQVLFDQPQTTTLRRIRQIRAHLRGRVTRG